MLPPSGPNGCASRQSAITGKAMPETAAKLSEPVCKRIILLTFRADFGTKAVGMLP